MSTLVGKYVLMNWVHEKGYVSNFLRLITRENKRYFIADVQRWCAKYHDKSENNRYVFEYSWAKKLFKDSNNELGFRRSIGRRDNTDGVMTFTIFDDISEVKCKYSFEKVFENDLRTIQDEDSFPLRLLKNQNERYKSRGQAEEEYKIEFTEEGLEPNHPIGGWDQPIIDFLKEKFKVDKVYSIYNKINEHRNQSILTKSGTMLHINNFHLNKKEITFDENYHNRSIMFWLFKDEKRNCLIFQYEDGKDTW